MFNVSLHTALTRDMREILSEHSGHLALVVGNGINRYPPASDKNSWDQLILQLAKKHISFAGTEMLPGMSLTEFYDILDINKSESSASRIHLQSDFCAGMKAWQPYAHHKAVVGWARANGVPILTTNFDDVLAQVGPFQLRPSPSKQFTDYYPWERYYSDKDLQTPETGFGIWHINGMLTYRRSVRLGLSHYMGSVERARSWIHKGKERRLFSENGMDTWRGSETWVHIVVSLPLLIFGLGLEENEVFLRWLLIERARYFKKYPARRKPAWYVYTSPNESAGKLFFLEGIGIQPVKVATYDDIYGRAVWT